LLLIPSTQAVRGDVEQRNEEDPENGRGDHAAENRRAHRVARCRPGPLSDNKRKKPKDEGEARHHHRAEPQGCGFNSGRVGIFTELALLHGKCNDQNSVLGSERDQRDEPDLRVNVEAQAGEQHRDEGAEEADADR